MYRDGKGVVQSFKKAVELFTMAAEKRNVNAMTNLGILYIRGQGVDQSNELAREWWTKAANEGHKGAIKNLKILDKNERKPTTSPPTTPASPPSSAICFTVKRNSESSPEYDKRPFQVGSLNK